MENRAKGVRKMEKFNYAKLRGFIAEHFVTHSNFAKFLGIGTTALSERMQNKVPFTQREIAKVAREATGKKLSAKEIETLFFTY
jgi:hypothetical protein